MLAKKKEKDVIDRMLDHIDFHGMTAEELAGENGLLKQLTSRFYSRALESEMEAHLGYKKNDNSGDNSGNSRNGYTRKTVITEDNDTIEIQVLRDRKGDRQILGLKLRSLRYILLGQQNKKRSRR